MINVRILVENNTELSQLWCGERYLGPQGLVVDIISLSQKTLTKNKKFED